MSADYEISMDGSLPDGVREFFSRPNDDRSSSVESSGYDSYDSDYTIQDVPTFLNLDFIQPSINKNMLGLPSTSAMSFSAYDLTPIGITRIFKDEDDLPPPTGRQTVKRAIRPRTQSEPPTPVTPTKPPLPKKDRKLLECRSPLAPLDPNTERPSQCAFCFGKAKGHKYDAPSCDGCKTYFKRKLSKGELVQCTNDEKCDYSSGKPRGAKCSWCRLLRCVGKGTGGSAMNPSAVELKENQVNGNELLPKLAERYRQYKGIVVRPTVQVDRREVKLMESLEALERRHDRLRRSEFGLHYDKQFTADPVARAPKVDESAYIEYSALPNNVAPELWNMKKDWKSADTFCAMEYVKSLRFYDKLNDNDKIALLKSTSVHVANLTQGYFSYRNGDEKGKMMYPDGTAVESESWVTKYFESKTMLALRSQKISREEYLLLKGLTVCLTGAVNLSSLGLGIVQKAQRTFSKILLMKCLDKKDASRYGNIICIQETLIRQADKQEEVCIFRNLGHELMNGVITDLIEDCNLSHYPTVEMARPPLSPKTLQPLISISHQL